MFMATSSSAYSFGFNTFKGCFLMGGIGVGGTALALSQSKIETKSSQALAISGITSCLIGVILSQDMEKKAEANAAISISLENEKLKNQAVGIMLELCIMKGECSPDGKPLNKKKVDTGASYYKVNESPNSKKDEESTNYIEEKSSNNVIKLNSGN